MRTPEELDLLRQNRLLALLEEETLAAIEPDLTFVQMKLHDPVATEGRPMRHAWFPTDGIISVLGAGSRIEVGTVGNEGMAGLQLFLGTGRAPGEAFVQVSGHAWKMPAAAFQQAAQAHPSLAGVLHRYAQAMLVQASQGAACNRAHSPLQRCARWLLMTDDRVQGDSFDLTQQFLSEMLGERRPTVSRVASTLQSRGLIEYSRGRITVLDRKRLEETACPCYVVIRSEFDQLLRGAHPRSQRVRR